MTDKRPDLPRATRKQAQQVWDMMAANYEKSGIKADCPSARKVTAALAENGLGTSWRTILRWKDRNWMDVAVIPNIRDRLNDELRNALKKMPTEEADEIAKAGGLRGAIEGGNLSDADLARIEKRHEELMLLSDTQRHEALIKAREVMNIVIMEEASRKANLMVLMPQHTGAMVEAFTDSVRMVRGNGDVEPGPEAGDTARQINGKLIEHVPNPTADAISKFMAEVA